MESISLPKKISIKKDKDNEFKAEVTMEPLYPGYGPTIANALRRVLLGSLPGAAIYAFKIKGITHEFTTIDFVKEDVVDISLNLKRVSLKSYSDEPVMLTISANGEKQVTAGDIEKNSDIEIANPDQVILTLTDKAASIEMTFWVRQGRGYDTVESREKENLEVNAISIDSIFTPVHLVGYQVDNVRVGDRTDYDKVIMQIETNGTISVSDALKQSGSILADHFKLVSEFDQISEHTDSEEVAVASEETEEAVSKEEVKEDSAE
ncbi:DNA-directed RNA polymerase subunit alpha [bacterium CG10_46_32]|nr:MAG: DNA-directed RNA polymerase subunit alpha [bacterium CG10_46_32]PIR55924.1 MAG: DNA-directed RNA polymerase subunit alpha [Parcubacteria group bacterium CG10_big_fil_rev_8_21_14_0_10_46_32]